MYVLYCYVINFLFQAKTKQLDTTQQQLEMKLISEAKLHEEVLDVR